MPGRRDGKARRSESYQVQLRQAMSRCLPGKGLATLPGGRRLRWTDRLLVVCAILIGWEPGLTLTDRFAGARACLVGMFPGRRRPGGTYDGFIAALAARSDALLGVVAAHLRRAVREAAEAAQAAEAGCWAVAGGWVVFGADGTKTDCPMTAANEAGFGLASRAKSWPQQLLTTIFHVGTGLPWAFRRGGSRASERSHLLEMLGLLPPGALLLADAGFTGYDLLAAVTGGGRSFLIRVGGNVTLLTRLGYAVREFDGLVYLWPGGKRKAGSEPLVLRLISFRDGRNRAVHLLTDVLDAGRLGDAAALDLYRRRWGVELLYRALKQTLGRRKMLSDCPAHAAVELDWSVVGLWMLALAGALAAGPGAKRSLATLLRAVRSAMAGRRGGGGRLWPVLSRAVCDVYPRNRPKKSRHWPHKKKEKLPGDPKARTATDAEVQLAQKIRATKAAA
jgi:hypothetical protein